MAGLFSSGRVNNPQPPATSLRVTTSLQGQSRPIVYGQTRIAANLIDYAGFKATAVSNNSGGKGGLVGSGGKGGNSGQYDYQASVIASFGEAISNVVAIYNSSAVDFLQTPSAATLTALAQIGITPTFGNTYSIELHTGSNAQPVSSFWNGAFPSRTLAYRSQAYAVFPNLQLGSSPTFPNFNFEILGAINSDVPTLGPDANPADVIADLLTNPVYGVPGFSSPISGSLLGDFNTARNYWRATGLMISLALTNQTAASSTLKDLLKALNAEFRWSNGKLDIMPYGDVAVSGNGFSYTPNTTPVYDLTPDDFLPNQGSFVSSGGGTTAIAFSRKDPVTVPNMVRIEYVNRNALYNPALITATDDASIAQNGLRMSDKRQNHFFALTSAASTSAALQLHRELAAVTSYQITVGRRFGLLEPLDLITISEPALSFSRKLVRITEIQENGDASRTLTLEEVPLTAHAPAYGRQADLGAGRNSNLTAPSVNTPFFFEPPYQLSKDLVLLVGISGSVPSNWGGCQVWISSDQTSYTLLGEVTGSTRMGVTTAALPSIAAAASGATLDTINTLSIDLTESLGWLGNGSSNDLAAFNTAVVVDKEIIAYQNATLTASNHYNLAPLSRGGYGTSIASHATGAPFMRLDGSAFEWSFTPDRIGSTLYFKFVSFNPFGAGWQALSDAAAYSYTIKGPAAPLGVSNFSGSVDVNIGILLSWSALADPILGGYEIRCGTDWATGSLVVTNLQATSYKVGNVPTGSPTYWIKAVNKYGVYSQNASSLVVPVSGATAPIVTATISDRSVILTWNSTVGTFQTDHYTISYGSTALGTVKATTFSLVAQWSGARTFSVQPVDAWGNLGAIGSVTVTIASPSAVTITNDVIDNYVKLYWTVSTGTLPIASYEVRKGTSYATSTLIGQVNSTFDVVFETTSGAYTYWVTGIDTAGNYGTPSSKLVNVSPPPDFILLSNQSSNFSGTANNLVLTGGALVGPVNTTETIAQHFSNNGFASPQAQISAGYPYLIEPTPLNASYTETIDYGAILGSSSIKVALTYTVISGAFAIIPTISVKQILTDPWIDYVGSSSLYAANFRYVKISYAITQTDGKGVISISGITTNLSVKTTMDSGNATGISTDTAGTTITFNKQFVVVQSISITPIINGGVPTAAYWVVNYDTTQTYPTSFKVQLFNASGTRVNGTFTWTATGQIIA
jgi:Putative phage tail protein